MGLNFKQANKINSLISWDKNNHLTINYEFRFDIGFKNKTSFRFKSHRHTI